VQYTSHSNYGLLNDLAYDQEISKYSNRKCRWNYMGTRFFL